MPDDPNPSSHHVPLNVLPHSNKVEQLKNETSSAPAPAEKKNFADRSVIDRVLDARHTPEQKKIVEKVIDVVKTVYDPEIPVNIYELGLIYDIRVNENNAVHVKMTLTAPGCPVAGTLPVDVERKIESIPEVTSATVELVWDPPWSKDRMSEAAILELGL